MTNDLFAESGRGLFYNGVEIRDKGDMLSLTDMWKAAGADNSRQPANWTASADGDRFIEYATEILNPGNSRNDLVKSIRGGRQPGTWAHWQIGLAYAKYLSPGFHMWCNTVVRAHMEGKPVSTAIPAETLAQIERSFGIMRMLAHKVTEMEKALPLIASEMADRIITARLAESAILMRQGKTAKQIWDAAGLPKRIKGSSIWFGNKLAKGGAMIPDRADRGDLAIRLFDPDRAAALLDLGLLNTARNLALLRRRNVGSQRQWIRSPGQRVAMQEQAAGECIGWDDRGHERRRDRCRTQPSFPPSRNQPLVRQ